LPILTNTFTLIAPAGSGVVDGQRCQISDGVTTVTFEFETAGGVAPGNVPIVFDPADTPAKMASRIRDAINAQGSLLVGAVAIASSNRVELTGVANVIVNDVPRNL